MRVWLPSGVAVLGLALLRWSAAPWALRWAGVPLLLLGLLLLVPALFLLVPPPHRAFLRRRRGAVDVILDRSALVFPLLHEVVPVTLAALILRVAAWADAPLTLADGVRAAVEIHAFARVPADQDAIRRAGAAFGEAAAAPDALARAAQPLVADAVRARFGTCSWGAVDRCREDLGEQLSRDLAPLLEERGLRLERVLLVHLRRVEDEAVARGRCNGAWREGGVP